jgi:ELWxxDGT repeat protein
MRRALAGFGIGAVIISFAVMAAVFQPVQLLLDLNQAPTPVNSDVVYLCESTVAGYFWGRDEDDTLGVWASDGTPSGTKRIASFGTYTGSEYAECLYWTGSLTFFQVIGHDGVAELWRTDGTGNGTFRLLRQPDDGGPIYFMGHDGLYAFMAGDGTHGNEIMVTDGTVAGTRLLVDLSPGADGSWISNGQSIAADGQLWFAHHGNLWVSDFTAGGTRQVTNFTYDPDYENVIDTLWPYHGGVLFRFIGGDGTNALYFSDGIQGAEQALKTLPPSSFPLNVGSMVVRDDLVLFTVSNFQTGETTLWTTDGTPAQTRQIPGPDGDLDPGYAFSVAGAHLVFQGRTAATGRELWTSDGTDSGTRLIRDFSPGPDDSSITVEHVSGGYSAMRVILHDGTRPIWITDGTPSGTRSVTALDAGVSGDTFNLFTAGFLGEDYYFWEGETLPLGETQHYVLWRYRPSSGVLENRGTLPTRELSPSGTLLDRRLLFVTNDLAVGVEPWVSDGSVAGTRLLANLAVERNNGSSDPDAFIAYDGIALFGAMDDDGQRYLWRSDGTAANTQRVGDAAAPVDSIWPSNIRHVRLGNQLLYGGQVRYDQWELWSTDGTVPGTHRVIDLSSTTLPFTNFWTSDPASCGVGFVTLNGKAYYGAWPGRVGTLYRTDGTEAGTQALGSFPTSARLFVPTSQVCVQAAYKNRVYFTAEDFDLGTWMLWRNDGAVGGNTHFKNAAGRDLRANTPLVEIDSMLYFVATDGVESGLWRSDGDPSGTVLVVPASTVPEGSIGTLLAVGRTIYFTSCTSQGLTVCRLYRTDGTPGGTFPLAVTFNDSRQQLPGNPVTADGELLFVGRTDQAGQEPWITDGTVAGTRMLRDVVPGTVGSNPTYAFQFNGYTYFYVERDDGNYSLRDLWRTDGTPENTERANLMPTGSSVITEHAVVAGQRVLLGGYNDTIGNELWVVENEAPVAVADSASTTSGTAVDIDAATNDSDPDGLVNAASLRIVRGPTNGTAVVSAGKLRYTSSAGFVGSDSFTYAISDRQQRESATATVSVTVSAAPAPAPPPGGSGGGGKKGGGGGAFDLGLLAALALAAAHATIAGSMKKARRVSPSRLRDRMRIGLRRLDDVE